MHATLPLLATSDFPAIVRGRLETLQLNLGYLCNQSCLHCHVNAGPKRKELMTRQTMDQILACAERLDVRRFDLTGGAPELNPDFRYLVRSARERGIALMDRCNLTVLSEPGHEDLVDFLADNGVDVVASLPCYLEQNVDAQRGDGVFQRSIQGLRQLNRAGYGQPDSGLSLSLVYNPAGPDLPPPQQALEAAYKDHLKTHYGIVFNRLFTLANMPIQRFGSTLVSRGQFDDYMALLRSAHSEANLSAVMCRSLLSIDWQGYLYDCDFNQMLGLPLRLDGRPRTHISQLTEHALEGNPIVVADHCYGCTAGQGSSCGGALNG